MCFCNLFISYIFFVTTVTVLKVKCNCKHYTLKGISAMVTKLHFFSMFVKLGGKEENNVRMRLPELDLQKKIF